MVVRLDERVCVLSFTIVHAKRHMHTLAGPNLLRLRLTCTLRLIREGRRKRRKELREGGQEEEEPEDLCVKEGSLC